MIVIGIDPGLQATGYAVLRDGELVEAGFAGVPSQAPLWQALDGIPDHILARTVSAPPDVLAIERMQVYDRAQQKGRQSDLVNLAMLGGAISYAIAWSVLELPTPREWNKGAPTHVQHHRVRKALDAQSLEYLERVSASHLGHNVWAATGIALWAYNKHKGD